MPNTTNKEVVIIERDSNSNSNTSNTSSNGAFKGAATGAIIGCRFGPVGIIAGTAIGGVLGFLIDD